MNDSHQTDEAILQSIINTAAACAESMEAFLSRKSTLDAINQATEMLNEMRTAQLSPKAYYQLFILATDKLRVLEAYLCDEHKMGRIIPDLYKRVQWPPNVLPRLYLMITVGVYLIKSGACSRCEMIRDLVEMCRGVQHPLRGLFLRSYLLQSLRINLLPDVASQDLPVDSSSELSVPNQEPQPPSKVVQNGEQPVKAPLSADGTFMDSVDFLLLNFSEMNKLWVRMQYQGHSRDRERREQERQELRLLVGTNLTRLSQLEGMDVNCYRSHVLPALCEQLIQCGDLIAQEYLMDVIIQVFPDEFHLNTLDQLLHVCSKLQPGVKLRQIVCSLVERLAQYTANEQQSGRLPRIASDTEMPTASEDAQTADLQPLDGAPPGSAGSHRAFNLRLFQAFFSKVCRLIDYRLEVIRKEGAPEGVLQSPRQRAANGLPSEDLPPIFASLMRVVLLLCQEDCTELVDKCLQTTARYLADRGVVEVLPKTPLSLELLRLLSLPLDSSASAPARGSAISGSYCRPPGFAQGEAAAGWSGGTLDLRAVLGMPGFRWLVGMLEVKELKSRLAYSVLSLVLERDQGSRLPGCAPSVRFRILSEEDLDNLFDLASGLLQPRTRPAESRVDRAGDEQHLSEQFIEPQLLVAGMLHLLGPEQRAEDPRLCYRLLHKAHKKLAAVGPPYVRFHYPVLVHESLQLLKTTARLGVDNADRDWSEDVQAIGQLIHHCITGLVAAEAPEMSLKLYLKAAIVMDGLVFKGRDALVYEFMSQALALHEEGVGLARSQVYTLSLVINSLCRVVNLDRDSREVLCKQCTRAATQLLQKHDQSRSVALVAHVYWPMPPLARNQVVCRIAEEPAATAVGQEGDRASVLTPLRDGTAALNCLRKACSLAHDCIDEAARAQLLLDCLDVAIGLRLNGCTQMTDNFINELVASVRELVGKLSQTYTNDMIATHLANTIAFIQSVRSPQERADENGGVSELSSFFATVKIEPAPVR